MSRKKTVKDDKRTRTMKIFSIASILIAFVIVLVGNILFDGILGDKLTFDLSSTEQNSISQGSIDLINALPADCRIRIVGLMERPVNIKNNYFEYVVPLLDDYEAESGGRITVEYIDPTTYPAITSELDPTGANDLEENTYVIKYGDRIRVINPYDCYIYDEEMYYYYNMTVPTTNIAEAKFTTAITQLTSESYRKAYFVTGLANSDDHEQLSYILNAMNVDSENIPVSNEFSIPADCDILFIVGINADITERVCNAAISYLNNGGKIFVAVNYRDNAGVSFVHLNELLSVMNLHLGSDMIKENDPDYSLNANGYQSIVSLSSSFAQSSDGSDPAMFASYMRPVSESGNPDTYITTMDILLTSQNAGILHYDETNNQLVSTGDGSQYSVAKYATVDGGDLKPELFLFGTTDFTSDQFISDYGSNISNIAFIRGIIRTSLGTDDSSFDVSKPIADYSIDYAKVTSTSINVLTICFLVIIPLTFISCGIVIYSKRKNL